MLSKKRNYWLLIGKTPELTKQDFDRPRQAKLLCGRLRFCFSFWLVWVPEWSMDGWKRCIEKKHFRKTNSIQNIYQASKTVSRHHNLIFWGGIAVRVPETRMAAVGCETKWFVAICYWQVQPAHSAWKLPRTSLLELDHRINIITYYCMYITFCDRRIKSGQHFENIIQYSILPYHHQS